MQLPRTKQYIVPQPSPTTKPHTRVIQWCGCRGGDSSGGEGGCHANRRGWGLHNVEDLHQRGLVADQCAQACQTRHTHIGVWRAQKCRWQSQPQWQKNGRVLLTKTMVTQYNSQHKIPLPPEKRKQRQHSVSCTVHSIVMSEKAWCSYEHSGHLPIPIVRTARLYSTVQSASKDDAGFFYMGHHSYGQHWLSFLQKPFWRCQCRIRHRLSLSLSPPAGTLVPVSQCSKSKTSLLLVCLHACTHHNNFVWEEVMYLFGAIWNQMTSHLHCHCECMHSSQ